MARNFSPHTLKKLQGQTFDVGGYELQFTAAPGWGVCMIEGGEGFATPVIVRSKNAGMRWSAPFVLKAFKEPTLRRRQRTAFLCALKLPHLKLPVHLFEGAPTEPFAHTFSTAPAPIAMEGYLAPCVAGEAFGDLMIGDKRPQVWDPPLTARVSLARQLCLAVELLEGAGMVHGDLAPGNLMIVDPDGPAPQLRLVDFDGFQYPGVPVLSVKEGRTWGTDGYRARAFRFGDEGSVQTTDRIAMAVLVMELVTRRHDDVLEEDLLLLQRSIDKGQASVAPAIAERWPDGLALLRRAMAEDDPRQAPSPREWRLALSHLASATHPFFAQTAAQPSQEARFCVRVFRDSQDPHPVRLRAPRGSFDQAAPELHWLAYVHEGDNLLLSGTTPLAEGGNRAEPLFIRSGGQGTDSIRRSGNIHERVPMGCAFSWSGITIVLD